MPAAKEKIKTKNNQMRKLIYAINLTLDGCCDHTKFGPDEALFDYYIALLRDTDTFLYGRKTYQLMVPYWPDEAKTGDEYGRAFVAVDKIIVCSKSLDKAEGKNTTIIRENLQEEILKLKQEPGKNILTGGVDIPAQLIESGLLMNFVLLFSQSSQEKGGGCLMLLTCRRN